MTASDTNTDWVLSANRAARSIEMAELWQRAALSAENPEAARQRAQRWLAGATAAEEAFQKREFSRKQAAGSVKDEAAAKARRAKTEAAGADLALKLKATHLFQDECAELHSIYQGKLHKITNTLDRSIKGRIPINENRMAEFEAEIHKAHGACEAIAELSGKLGIDCDPFSTAINSGLDESAAD